MKKVKRILAMLMAMAMVLGMAITASADQVITEYQDDIKITNLAEGVSTEVKVYNIIYLDQDASGNQSWVVVDWVKNYIELDATNGEYVITDKNGLKAAAETQTATYTATVTETECEFTGVPIGAYVVLADDTAGTYGLMVTNTYNENEKYMASQLAEVTAKLEEYVSDKTASDSFVHRGQNVEFTITTKFPTKEKENEDGTITSLTEFKITDIPNGLLVFDELPTVKIGNATVTITADMVTNTVENGATTEYVVDLSGFIASSAAGSTVEIKYNATVVSEDGYNNSVGISSNTVDYKGDTTKGFEADITLTKVDEDEDGEILEGAEFQVYKDAVADDNSPLYFVKISDGVYRQALSADEEGATQTVVATKGTVQVKGLDEGTYNFKETKAPKGYSLVDTPKEVVVEANDSANVTLGVTEPINFVNTKLANLPATGGIGTYIFTIAGIIIMAAAAGFFFVSRRKANR